MPTTPSGAEPQSSEPAEAATPRETAAAASNAAASNAAASTAAATTSGDTLARDTLAGETASPTPLQAGAADLRPSGGAEPQQPAAAAISTEALIEQLQADRLWLLRQIDAGAYPELRLDLAALERELGQLLDQAGERIAGS